jgi:hypothetical protein
LPAAGTRPPAERLPASTPPLPPPLRRVNGQPTTARPPAAATRAGAGAAERDGHTPSSATPQPPLAPTPFPRTPTPRIEDLHGGPDRRPSLITIAALVLVVMAAVLIPYLIDRSRGDSAVATAPTTPTAAATTANASTTPSPEPAAAPPPGFRLHRDPTGFSIAVPNGWREERDGSLVDFHDPTSSRFIRIDQREDPRTEPYDDWISQEPTYKQRLPGYALIRIANVQYRGWRTADWEFTWGAAGSERSHVRIRNVVPNEFHGYALYWSTADSDWADDLAYFDIFVRTFAPKAGR